LSLGENDFHTVKAKGKGSAVPLEAESAINRPFLFGPCCWIRAAGTDRAKPKRRRMN